MRLTPFWCCGAFGRRGRLGWPWHRGSRASSRRRTFAAKCWNWPDRGALRAIGGPLTPGRATNGISPSAMARSTASAASRAAGSSRAAMTEGYVELHARSGFSFLEGASVPEDLAGACAEFGMPAMALVDRNGVYGAPRFHMAAKKAGIRAHIGSEITCTNGRTYPLLAETREGYQNLCRL